MDSFALFHFAIKKNDRVYQVVLQPGAPWDEINQVMDDFKAEFAALKLKADEEAAKKPEESAVVEPAVLDPEIVSQS